MLRIAFVLLIILVGAIFAFQGPFYILLFYLWNAYFRPDYWVWGPFIRNLNLSLILGGALLVTSLGALTRLRLTWQLTLVLLFLAQSTLSTVLSEHYADSLLAWIDFAKVLVVVVLMTVLVTTRERFRLALLVICFSLGLEAAKQGWATLVLSPGATNINRHPMLGDNNGVAVGMMMLIPLFFALDQVAKSKWEHYLHRFFIVGVFYRGISTYSRGGFLTAAVLGLMLFWYSPKRWRALILVASLSSAVLFVMPQAFWDRIQTITAPAEERDASQVGRLFFWGVATDMARAKPMTGVGFNAYKLSFSTYDRSGGDYGEQKAAHSAWFGVLAELGYPGLILLVAIILFSFKTSAGVWRRARSDPDMKDLAAYASAIQMSLVAYCVGNTFLSGQYNEFFWHLIGLGMALQSIAATAMAQKAPAVPARPAFPQVSASARRLNTAQ